MSFVFLLLQLNSNYYNSHQGVANRSYLNASPMSNASGRPQTNSAPVPNNASYGYSTGGNSRPLSSTGNNHIHQTNHFSSNTRQGKNGPVIMRNLDKPSGVGSQVRLIKNTKNLNSSNYSSVRLCAFRKKKHEKKLCTV